MARIGWFLTLLCLASLGWTQVVSLQEDTVLAVPLWDYTKLKAVIPQGLEGKALPGGASIVDETTQWAHAQYLLTGKTDQAIMYPLPATFTPAQWSISFCVIGRDWAITREEADVFFRLNGKDATLELQRAGGAQLRLTLTRAKGAPMVVTAPLPADMSKVHQIMVTCGEGQAKIYLDARVIGSGTFSTEKLTFTEAIFGQAGPGAAQENRLMSRFAIYKRALSAGEVARTWYDESRIAVNRSVSVVKTTRKITIDGEVDLEEWRDAAEVTGMVHSTLEHGGTRMLAKDQTRYFVTYDDENLYVAMISAMPEKVKNDPHMTAGMGGLLKTTEGAHDAAVDNDDVFEVDVFIPRRNGDLYRLVVNGINTTYDYTTGGYAPESVLKGIDINWEPKWEAKANRVDVEKGWRAEARIPLDSFKAPNPQPGTEWGINFKRYWQQLQAEQHAWTWGERLEPDREFLSGAYSFGVPGRIVFQGAEGTAVQVDTIGRPNNGQLQISGRVVSTAKNARQVKLALSSDSGEVTGEQTVAVPAGGATPFEFSARIKQFTTNRVTLTAEDAGTNIYTMELPVFLGQGLDITSRSYPTPGFFKVEMDLTGLSDYPLHELSAVVKLVNTKNGKAAITRKISKLTGYFQDVLLDVNKLAVGQYEAQATVLRKGKALVTKTLPFDKQPLPEWYGNTIGISEEVPPPFMPVRVKDDVVRVWGREYHFAGGLFPQKVVVLGRQLLREPMRVHLTTPEGKVLTDANGTVEAQWTKVTDARAECTRTVTIGDYTLQNTLWIEYDGFIWNTLKVTNAKKTGVNGLKLIIPYTKEFSDVINPYDYSLRTTGKLQPEGWNGSYRPVWVGNAIGGLQWMAESDGDWNVADVNREIEVTHQQGTATMAVNFVDQPTHLDTPLPLPFGLVATPVKKTDRSHRNTPVQWGYAWYPPGEMFMPGAKGWYRKDQDAPGFIRDEMRGDFAASKHFSKRYTKEYNSPYVTTLIINTATPDFRQFGNEWSASEHDRGSGEVSQASKSFQDYFVWQYWKLYENSPFAGLYYDVSNEANGLNRFGSCGYQRRDGTWVAAKASLGNREIAKRLYTMVKSRHPDAVIKFHNSGLVNMAYMGFCDYFVEGECTINMLTQDKPDYLGKIRPDTYRAEMMGHNFGFVTDFLYQFTRSGMWSYDGMRKAGPYMVDHIIGMTLLHDCTLWASYAPHEYWVRVERALEKVGFGPNFKMKPYWEQTICQLPENQFVTFYVNDFTDTAIGIFYNDSTAKGEQRVKLDWAKLGYADLSRVIVKNTGHELTTYKHGNPNIWHDYQCDYRPNPAFYARIEDGELVMPLMPYDYQMVIFTME
jgi:hypothetical protein